MENRPHHAYLIAVVSAVAAAQGVDCQQTGCAKDTDCKGQRVCVAGACMDAPPRLDAAPGTAQDAGPPDEAPPSGSAATAGARCLPGMVLIPETEFDMGSDTPYPRYDAVGLEQARDFGWQPRHRVRLSAYCIDRFEVTVLRFDECVKVGRCTPPGRMGGPKENTNYGVPGKEQHPINLVSYDQARAFCEASGARLPTEAEWELAARGRDGREYPFLSPADRPPSCGDVLTANGEPRLAAAFGEGSTCIRGVHGSWPVGSAPDGASVFGLLDMAGNVMEWVEDRFDATFYRRLAQQSAGGPARDPRNPPTSSKQDTGIVRGGGWSTGGGLGNVTPAWNMTTYWREPQPYYTRNEVTGQMEPTRDAEIGFRCATSPQM